MARELIWSSAAEKEKNDILHFWIQHNKSNAYSIKLEQLINEAVELLPYYPYIGRKTDFGNIRLIVAENYLIFYEVLNTQIQILSILDGRQDPEKITDKFS
jgi:toxin YoeB